MTEVQAPQRESTTPKMDYRRRQEALRDRIGGEGVQALLVSRDCDIAYLTGFCGHDSLLLITGDGAFCISDNRYEEQLRPLESDGDVSGVIGTRHRLHETVADLVAQQKLTTLGIQADDMTVTGRAVIEGAVSGTNLVDTTGLVGALRMRKDESEIAAIRKAIDINLEALRAMLGQIALGMTEREIAALLEYEMKRRGASGTGFTTIVAVGEHGALPHYETGDTPLTEDTSLLIDWGCVVDGYNADLTRTFGVGRMPEKIAEIYAIVLDAQLAAIDAAAPGKTCAEIDAVARQYIDSHGYGDYFGHGLGHGLGLQVHEPPYFNHLQTEVVLEPGIVMTVEPGIYLPGVGGVRIEDDVVITEDGCRVLSSFEKNLDAVTLTPPDGSRQGTDT